MNMNRYLSTGMALAVCLVTAVSAQEAKEQKLKLKDVPAPVVAAATKAYPNAKIREWAKETEAGKPQYEASIVEGPTKRDLLFAPNGAVVPWKRSSRKQNCPQLSRIRSRPNTHRA